MNNKNLRQTQENQPKCVFPLTVDNKVVKMKDVKRFKCKNRPKKNAKNKTVECEVCGKFFSSKGCLSIHKVSHMKNKPYNCRFCSKGFPAKYHLERHEKIHTGENPYKCQICGKGFTENYKMKNHMERMHENGTKNLEVKNWKFDLVIDFKYCKED